MSEQISIKPKSLKSNTLYLYLLTFSNYLLGFLTVPYQTRILGPEAYGIVSFATAIAVYFNLFLDFGFLLSGTKSVNKSIRSGKSISIILTSITIAKLLLFCTLVFLFLILVIFIPTFHKYTLVLSLYLLLSLLNSLLPDYIYRGFENMKKLTFRTIFVRAAFTMLIFIFMNHPDQYYFVPLFQIIGAFLALVWSFYDIQRSFMIKFTKVTILDIFISIKEASIYFLSRIATTIYNGTNTVILGFIYPESVVGFYTTGTKVRQLFSQAEAPICDSIYPYMTRTSNFKRLFRITIILEIPIIIAAAILWIYAKPIMVFVFGQEYAPAADILRLTIPIIIINFPGKMFGFPALTPLGKEKWANLSNVIAMTNQLILISLLFLFDSISIKNIIICTIISEYLGASIRFFIFIKAYVIKKNYRYN